MVFSGLTLGVNAVDWGDYVRMIAIRCEHSTRRQESSGCSGVLM